MRHRRRRAYGPPPLLSQSFFTVKLDGSELRQITPWGIALNFTCGSWPPQGNEIVFSAHVRRDEHSTIWVVHSTTSGPKRSDSAKPRRPEVRRY